MIKVFWTVYDLIISDGIWLKFLRQYKIKISDD